MSFSEIIGQEEVKKLLVRTLSKQRIAQAYLFCGPEGVGKTSTAVNFVKAMNCKKVIADSCRVSSEDKCSSCRKIDAFSHPDIKIIFPVSKKVREKGERSGLLRDGKMHLYAKTDIISIDDVREIEEGLLLKPFEAKKRAIIIVDSETMKESAQNAFLKTLEEPPKNTSFILTSSHPERLLPTIRSRCMIIRFRRLSLSEMKEFLEGAGKLTDEEVMLFSLLSEGSVKRAMEFQSNEFIQEREMFSRIVIKNEYDILDETYDKDTLERFMRFLVLFFRDIEINRAGGEVINYDLKKKINSISHNYTEEELREAVAVLGGCFMSIPRNINPQLVSNIAYSTLKE